MIASFYFECFSRWSGHWLIFELRAKIWYNLDLTISPATPCFFGQTSKVFECLPCYHFQDRPTFRAPSNPSSNFRCRPDWRRELRGWQFERISGIDIFTYMYSFSHNHGSGKWLLYIWKVNYYWRDPFLTSMIMGGSVYHLKQIKYSCSIKIKPIGLVYLPTYMKGWFLWVNVVVPSRSLTARPWKVPKTQ